MNFPYILAADMNTAAIFITSSVLKKHAGAILIATDLIQPLQEHHIKLGISSLKQLIRS